MSISRPAYDKLRAAIEALVVGSGSLHLRLQAAEVHFGEVRADELESRAEHDLFLRIGSGLVEGGEEESTIAESIAALADDRALELALELLSLYELVAVSVAQNR